MTTQKVFPPIGFFKNAGSVVDLNKISLKISLWGSKHIFLYQ